MAGSRPASAPLPESRPAAGLLQLVLLPLLVAMLASSCGGGCLRGEPSAVEPQAASGSGRAATATANAARAAAASPVAFDSIRRAAVAGSWYPAEPEALGRLLDGFIAQAAPPRVGGRVVAVVSPHAGYEYSGLAAAHAMKLLRGQAYERVIILAPSHYAHFEGIAAPEADAYQTPLGLLPVDTAAAARLRSQANLLFHAQPVAEAREHAVEMQLPLLQRGLAPGFRILPLVLGEMTDAAYRVAAAALRPLLGPGTLVVASSDFTHRGPHHGYDPFPGLPPAELERRLRNLDLGALEPMRALDRPAFEAYVARTGATICGARPIALLLELLAPRRAELTATLLSYRTSADSGAGWENSVSYVDLVLSAPEQPAGSPTASPAAPPAAPPAASPAAAPSAYNAAPVADPLSSAEKQTLLRLARRAMEEAVRGRIDRGLATRFPLTPRLRQPSGAFVTLKKHGELRGCIGSLEPVHPLHEAVRRNAIAAALEDHRFSPVVPEESAGLRLEVSVLTPPREVPSAEAIVIGRDGMILEKDGRAATFLPQVAPEQGWDREQTLSHLSRKAGLAPDAWRQGARFLTYQAMVFAEGE